MIIALLLACTGCSFTAGAVGAVRGKHPVFCTSAWYALDLTAAMPLSLVSIYGAAMMMSSDEGPAHPSPTLYVLLSAAAIYEASAIYGRVVHDTCEAARHVTDPTAVRGNPP